MIRRLALSAALALTAVAIAESAQAGTVTFEQHVGRAVRVFVPTKPASPTPLVIMLHGCTQTADAFADATRMDAVAEENGFVVAYPEQSADTIPTKCFRWYEPAHQARDAGEPKELADAADEVAKAHGVDPERVYIAGISAGAAMSVILGATYPDRFTAIGVVAGVEFRGATSFAEAFNAASNGGPDPDQQGVLALAAMGPRAHPVPVFVVHGTADGVLAKVNGDQVATQWRKTNTLVLGEGAIEPVISVPGDAGYPFTRRVHRNKANGASVIEQYVIDGLGHAWPGGKDGGSYSDAKGPDASRLMWAFFAGRTRSKPLDVTAVVVPPAGSGSGSGSGGGSGGGGGSGSGGGGGSGEPARGDGGGGSGGGCGVSPGVHGGASRVFGAGALFVALLTMRRAARRRS